MSERLVARRGSNAATLLAIVLLDRHSLAGTIAYFGPMAPIWALAGPLQKNGLRAVSIRRAAALMAPVTR